ncbi:hypothetical protein DV738_g5294, partial [Chaetothyriales sp. CBS 135597]
MAHSESPVVNLDLAINQVAGNDNIVHNENTIPSAEDSAPGAGHSIPSAEDSTPNAEHSKDLLPGVARVEVAATQLNKPKQWTLFTFVLLFGFSYGLDTLVRGTFITYATVSFGNHSLITTVSIVQGVIAAAIQPSVAKLADAFGRFEIFAFGVFLYTLGTVVEAVAVNVAGLASGAVVAQLGFNIFVLTLDIIIADVTSLKTRLFFTYLPNLPYLVNTWIGGSSSKWDNASILAPVILGALTLVCFVLWERKTPYPLLPAYLLNDQMVWWCILITILYTVGYTCHVSYLFTLLIVSYNFSIEAATTVASVSGFSNALASLVVSTIVIKVRHLKGFILAGIGLAFVAFGLTYHYRGGMSSQSGLIGAETAAQHQHMGVLIALLFTSTNMGSAIGSCISGAIWTQTLYNDLNQSLAPFGNSTLATLVYASPLTVVPEYPVGTPVRDAIIESYQHIQRLLSITCLCLSIPMLIFGLFLRDPRLSDLQTQPEAELNAAAEKENRRQLGIPTANIPPEGLADHPDLKSGVYFGFVGLLTTESTYVYPAVLSIGYNPYYKNETRSVEIHILHHFVHYNFYSSPLNLLILGFIRPEYDYESVDALVADIKTDCQVAARSLERPNWDKWRRDEWLSAFDWAHDEQSSSAVADDAKASAER